MRLEEKSLQGRSVQIKSEMNLMKLCEFLQGRSNKELMELGKKLLHGRSKKEFDET
mgnify:CR=1 FL=1